LLFTIIWSDYSFVKFDSSWLIKKNIFFVGFKFFFFSAENCKIPFVIIGGMGGGEWEVENIILPFSHNLWFMLFAHFSFVLWAFILVEVSIDRTSYVLSQYEKKLKGFQFNWIP
jgi:hypothetical protein